jgi:jumonji domain-containing protein 7
MLYLPRLWYHHVTQAVGPSPDGVGTNAAIAVNWWYDMKMDGSFWSVASFIRRSTLLLDGRVEAEDPDLFS